MFLKIRSKPELPMLCLQQGLCQSLDDRDWQPFMTK